MPAPSKNSFPELDGGVVLAELGGYGDGPYCARHGRGAALVMLGTYMVDPAQHRVPYPPKFVFRPERSVYVPYLDKHIKTARMSGARVCVSVISIELKHTLDFLKAAQEAGADYASLCAHSEMEMFTRRGLGQTLCARANARALQHWAQALLQAVTIPIIFKIGLGDLAETLSAVDLLRETGIPIISINLHQTSTGSAGFQAIKPLAEHCESLIAGGGIQDLAGARAVLAEGATAVAIGTAAMKNDALCGEIQKGLKTIPPR